MNDSTDNPPPAPATPSLGQLWQLPLLIIAMLLLGVGWFVAAPEEQPRDYHAEVDAIGKRVDAGEFDAAIEAIKLLEAEPDPLPSGLGALLDLLVGDSVAGLQRVNEWDVPANHRLIVDRYRSAQQRDAELGTERLTTLADSLIALGRVDEAEKLIDQFDAAGRAERDKLRRRLIQLVADRPKQSDEAMVMLRRFLDDPDLAREHRLWAVAQMARVQLRIGPAVAAETLLMRWLPRLGYPDAEVTDLGELLVLLGEAHLRVGDRPAAERMFMAAREMLGAGDPLHGDALTGLGRVRFAEDNIVEALEFFSDAVTQYPDTDSYLGALVGKAQCEARLGSSGEALRTLSEATELAFRHKSRHPERFDLVADALATQREWRYGQGQFELALKYLLQEEMLHGDGAPADLTLRLATTHEQLARKLMGIEEGAIETDFDTAERFRQLDASTRASVALNYRKAADYFYGHAMQVAVTDDAAFGESLWRAADCYDKAGRHDRAIEVFQEYAKSRDDDPRRLNVMYRLAQAYQAEAQFSVAASMYRELIESNPKSPEAYASLVPLARCYLAQGADHWARAEQVLLSVVTDNEALRPESREYREALIELGRLYYRRGGEGDFVRAIERLEEASTRYGSDEVSPAMLFQLGDAYRKSVAQIDEKLAQPTPPSERAKFQAERADRLDRAQKCFDRVVMLYEAGDTSKLGDLDSLYLRNSYFYRADCAYDLGRYTGADGSIALYDRAVQRYENEPAVLIALIQIVNSYCELGEYAKARTANERARWHLNRIPDEAFLDPNLPMDREHWQRWLDWTSELSLAERAAADAGP